jgi:hypothetical protein
MTRDTPQGAHETPAWLGDSAAAPHEPLPLWPERHQPEHSEPEHSEPEHSEPARSAARIDKIEWWTEDEPASGPLAHHGANLTPLGVVAVTGRRAVRPPSSPRPVRRRPRGNGAARGLVALVLLALLAAFFAWVTAEPLWLAVGHSTPGAVTVTRCVDHGIDRRCVGTFSGATFTRTAVPVMGDVPDPGATVPASMTSAHGGRAYVDVDTFSRAAVGVVLIMLCGLGIVRATGVRRLEPKRARTVATLLSTAGPVTLLAGMLIATY